MEHYFDWDGYFYDCLPKNLVQALESKEILASALNLKKWQEKVMILASWHHYDCHSSLFMNFQVWEKRLSFFFVLNEWGKVVQEAVVSQRINWEDVPGYKIMARVFL